jgi:hypothetical protein
MNAGAKAPIISPRNAALKAPLFHGGLSTEWSFFQFRCPKIAQAVLRGFPKIFIGDSCHCPILIVGAIMSKCRVLS